MPRSTLILSILLLTATACDQPGDGTDASTGDATSATIEGASSGSSGGDSTGDAGEASTSSSTGDEGSGGFDGSGGETCFGASCIETGCAAGLVCAPHPDTAEPLCVTLCAPPFACNEAVPFACGTVAAVECRTDVDGPAMCFPIV